MSDNPQPSLIEDRNWTAGEEDIGVENLEAHGVEHERIDDDAVFDDQTDRVDTALLVADAVTSAIINSGAVDADAIDNDAVTTAAIAAAAVTSDEIAAGAVGPEELSTDNPDDKADDPHGNESHDVTFAEDGDEQPPESHDHNGDSINPNSVTTDSLEAENSLTVPEAEEGDTAEERQIAVSPEGELLIAKEQP